MPGMNGWDTLRRLRARRETAALPIVALTADRRESGAFRRAGFNAHVSKGGSLERFLVTVRAALDEHLGPERLWLQSCDAGRIATSPLLDATSSSEPLNDYVAGLPPISHHAVINGRQYVTPRV
jgi:DNA-binding response OmpR family regulator